MKLLIQSDDYGITKAVSLGIIEAIKNGMVRNTGLFSNMPWAKEVVELIKPYIDDIAFGLDLNISTGPSILDSSVIPHLVQDNGDFLTSSMNRALDTEENNYDHVNYEEVYLEFEAQIEKFIQLVGKKPDYLHAHAYGTPTVEQASKDLSRKYKIPYSVELFASKGAAPSDMGWYEFPPTPENQLKSSLKNYILKDKNQYLKHDYGFLVCHCGYADSKLFKLSSFNLYRIKDLEAMCDSEVKEWFHKNNIELVTYKDFTDLYNF
ncbi:MAG: ChbG/HpnK family deacetylase [Erysipelotrichaceae bacterium]|nr:ChbG/HpnK family deacetylase [Erysipelotrichaceae bacterium]